MHCFLLLTALLGFVAAARSQQCYAEADFSSAATSTASLKAARKAANEQATTDRNANIDAAAGIAAAAPDCGPDFTNQCYKDMMKTNTATVSAAYQTYKDKKKANQIAYQFPTFGRICIPVGSGITGFDVGEVGSQVQQAKQALVAQYKQLMGSTKTDAARKIQACKDTIAKPKGNSECIRLVRKVSRGVLQRAKIERIIQVAGLFSDGERQNLKNMGYGDALVF
jgi:hypothetical protein